MVEELDTADSVAVSLSCKTLNVSRSRYYAWLSRPRSKRHVENEALLPRIRQIHEKSKETYGSPRITAELRAEGMCVNEKRIARLMQENKIASETVKKFKVQTTDSNHNLPIAPRLFETEHASSVPAPDQVYVGDITYIWSIVSFISVDVINRKVFTKRAAKCPIYHSVNA